MISQGPAQTISLADRIIYEYDVLPFIAGPFTTAQLLGGNNYNLVSIFDPTGVNLIIPTPSGQEEFNQTVFNWRAKSAAQLTTALAGGYTSFWDGAQVKAWGNLNNTTITIDGERPPLVQFAEFDSYRFPRICKNVSIAGFSASVAYDFNSMTDAVNFVPDPAGPHILFISLKLTVELIKK